MLHVDIPSRAEFKAPNDVRSDACVSIYLERHPDLSSGARVLGVRRSDLPGQAELAAILRFPV